jgi:hypothetical protein
MVKSEPEPSTSDPAPVDNSPDPAPAGERSFTEPFGRLLALATAAGLIAGMTSVLAGEVILNSYQSELNPTPKVRPNEEDMRHWREARIYSATMTFATMGGLLGISMGLAGGLASRSVIAGLAAGISGLLLGAAAAASISHVLVSNFFKSRIPESTDLVLPLLTHGAIWSAVGVIGGLAFGLGAGGKGRWKATVLGGLVGAAAATIVYEIVGAVAFASSKTDLPLAGSSTTRGMAQLLVTILTAAGAGVAYLEAMKRESQSREPALAPSGQEPRA